MKRTLDVAILIDALGWEIKQHFAFCEDLLPNAAPLGTVLGYSSAAIPSLLTGEYPDRHGAWSMYKLSPSSSPFSFLRFMPPLPAALERRARTAVRKIVSRQDRIQAYYDLYDIPLHLLNLFDVASRQDPYLPGAMPVESLFDALAGRHIPYRLWNYRTPEEENMRELLDNVAGAHRVLFLYTAELDALMHRRGIFHDQVGRKLALYRDFIEQIIVAGAKAGVDIGVHVFSDHGMIDVSNTIDVWGAVTREGYRLGRDYMAFYDSTMARFWCDGGIASGIRDLLDGKGWGRMIPREELERLGCYFADGAYGNHIFLLAPGLMIVPSFMGTYRVAAMHGYDPADRFSMGCVLSNRPGITLPDSILGIKRYLLDRIGGTS
jgi:predicted AlkP superfamily pyrophosphatase or phosphodiesterase